MLSAYNSILAMVRARASSERSQTSEFSLFPSLPPELRIKIWQLALPSRIIEASLRHDGEIWRCHISKSKPANLSCQQVPSLFSVNAESRGVCLSSYIHVLPNFYIHRSLDVLYISWQQSLPVSTNGPDSDPITIQHESDSVPIQGRPFSQLHTVAMTLGRNTEYSDTKSDSTRFGALISCLRDFGTPKKLLLCLVGPNIPNLFSDVTGFSVSSGKNVILLDWPNKAEEHMGSSVRGHVMEALEAESSANPGFEIPAIDERLRYITVSNSSRHTPTRLAIR
ncbi:hypothetical protein VTL71DRAFT_15999 [Oculimacula yallundae]|uniref:2EXR domain-containing protein n=1 Tax=Oculimacula yallundae TaxID=86028 RepID=A0ABR4CD74_9HELO